MDAEKQFTKGFNDGYLLAEHAPAMVQKLVPSLLPANDYVDGLVAGTQEYALEKEQLQLDELGYLRNRDKDEQQRELG